MILEFLGARTIHVAIPFQAGRLLQGCEDNQLLAKECIGRNPLSGGAITSGGRWCLSKEDIERGRNPLSGGAITSGHIKYNSRRSYSMLVAIPFQAGRLLQVRAITNANVLTTGLSQSPFRRGDYFR
ncbi:hypothetical protein CCP3SC1_370007 [Gammaproteobacteria bacterium]